MYIYEWHKSQHLFDFTCSQAPRSPHQSKQLTYKYIGIGDYTVIRFEIMVIMSFHTSILLLLIFNFLNIEAHFNQEKKIFKKVF